MQLPKYPVQDDMQSRFRIRDLLLTAGILAAAFGLCLLLGQIVLVEHSDAYISMLFICAVFFIARSTPGYAYGIVSSLVSVLLVNYFFTYPYFAFNFSLPGYPITILCMLAVSLLTSAMTTRIKWEEKLRGDAEREKIRGNLLRAISHDLRTPLTSILGANSVLMENDAILSPEKRHELHCEIAEDAEWLIRMVENLLTITRIQQDGASRIRKTPELAEEVLAEAVDKFHRRFPERAITVSVPEVPIVCPMDAMLIEQVLLNLMENAAVHATGATKTELVAATDGTHAYFSVSDDGCGVPKERIATLFDDHGGQSGTGDEKRNMGIGLSVCSAIIRVHGGEMSAENRKGGGLTVSFTLPLEENGNEQF